ncbi:MAG: hypothetical protein JSU03_07390 [Bacteroidetes bacterium]|nr:hypothetical protein [Bacteroidota bacterium]MBS1757086.1 hypothetical protein [Bacteroidota bacterium]
MKKIIVTAALLFIVFSAFCQEQKNGTIYIKHPYIDVVMNANKDYTENNFTTVSKYYADTCQWWISGLEKFIPLADAVKAWKSDFDKFDDIKQTQLGYPDFLHYDKDNIMVVQSWWTWQGKSKKTGEALKVPMVIFDEFNTDGKISREYIYGDFSKLQ